VHVQTHMSNFVVSEPKFTGLFLPNAGEIAVDHMSFQLLISLTCSEIFGIELWSCPKSCRICTFGPQVFGVRAAYIEVSRHQQSASVRRNSV